MRDKTIRYSLAGYYLILVLSAVALGAIGGYGQYIYQNNYYLISSTFYVVGILAFLSCALTVFSFLFGCAGALSRHYCLTITFAVLLSLVVLSELCLGIAGFFHRNEMHSVNWKHFSDSLNAYGSQSDIAVVWDNVQKSWDCCGTDYYADWEKVFSNRNLPISCCRIDGNVGNVTCTRLSANLRREGCLNYFGAHLEQIVTLEASLGIAFAIVQVCGVVLSCYAATKFKRFRLYG